jgi:gamma-glutamylcyclotransferase (GGCT)/AIG2-like uncharacterized protein YtfP
MKHKVAVYGSLLSGFGNHQLLSTSKYLGITVVEGYDMYSLSAFPAVTPSPGGRIVAEVYEIDEGTLARLDRLESYPRFYNRMKTPVKTTDYKGDAWIYFIDDLTSRSQVHGMHMPYVETGSWREYKSAAGA